MGEVFKASSRSLFCQKPSGCCEPVPPQPSLGLGCPSESVLASVRSPCLVIPSATCFLSTTSQRGHFPTQRLLRGSQEPGTLSYKHGGFLVQQFCLHSPCLHTPLGGPSLCNPACVLGAGCSVTLLQEAFHRLLCVTSLPLF